VPGHTVVPAKCSKPAEKSASGDRTADPGGTKIVLVTAAASSDVVGNATLRETHRVDTVISPQNRRSAGGGDVIGDEKLQAPCRFAICVAKSLSRWPLSSQLAITMR
jgi:hypothetical protein